MHIQIDNEIKAIEFLKANKNENSSREFKQTEWIN